MEYFTTEAGVLIELKKLKFYRGFFMSLNLEEQTVEFSVTHDFSGLSWKFNLEKYSLDDSIDYIKQDLILRLLEASTRKSLEIEQQFTFMMPSRKEELIEIIKTK